MHGDFGSPLTAEERALLKAERGQLDPLELSLRAYDAAADVGDRMGDLILSTTDLAALDDVERMLRDARDRLELRLTEIAMRRVELTPPPPLLAAMEAA